MNSSLAVDRRGVLHEIHALGLTERSLQRMSRPHCRRARRKHWLRLPIGELKTLLVVVRALRAAQKELPHIPQVMASDLVEYRLRPIPISFQTNQPLKQKYLSL